MPEQMKVSVSALGKNTDGLKPIPPPLTQVISWIKERRLSPRLEDRMIERAKAYPSNALNLFMKDFNRHVKQASKNL